MIATYVYLNAQTTLLVGALLYLYIAHNRNYYFVRNMLLVAMVIALLCYGFYPTAPPRFFPEWGFIDTTGYVTGVSAHSAAASLFVNQYAAVPSMHVAFAVDPRLVAGRGTCAPAPARVFWALWPLVITFVTIITGNHFIFDARARPGDRRRLGGRRPPARRDPTARLGAAAGALVGGHAREHAAGSAAPRPSRRGARSCWPPTSGARWSATA